MIIIRNKFSENLLWDGKWRYTDGHLFNIKKCLDQGVKKRTSASSEIFYGERGLVFYFGDKERTVLQYFITNGFGPMGGPITYSGRVIADAGDIKVLADTLNKMNFMPSDKYIQWINSD